MAKITGGNIANVERVEVITQDGHNFNYSASCEASFTAAVSSGSEVELRVGDVLLGSLRSEDIIKGYDISLTDALLLIQILAVVDGGTYMLKPGGIPGKYEAPPVGSASPRNEFTLNIYTSDRDIDGLAAGYHRWSFPNCKGMPLSGNLRDAAFARMKYAIRSRPPAGTIPLIITPVSAEEYREL